MNAFHKKNVRERTYPDAFITINRNRTKIYPGNEIYMQDGTEFQLELDNRSRRKWLAKIKLNGEYTSEAGIILRPGEHFFLDTPDIDGGDRRRFLFETYEIEKGRSHLVSNNGRVEIEFYEEQRNYPYWITSNPMKIDWPQPDIWTSRSSGTGKAPFDDIHIYCSDVDSDTLTIGNSSNITFTSNHSLDQANNDTEETGRIEQGSQSNQDFVEGSGEFNYYATHTVKYKILPVSKKPVSTRELREYCSGCGRRRRKNENFCPSCGRRF